MTAFRLVLISSMTGTQLHSGRFEASSGSEACQLAGDGLAELIDEAGADASPGSLFGDLWEDDDNSSRYVATVHV